MKWITCHTLAGLLFALVLLPGCGREAQLTTNSPEALAAYQEGVSLWEKFYYAEASAAFERALKADTAFAMAWARLAVISFGANNEPGAQAAIVRALALSGPVSEHEQLFIRMWERRIHFANDAAAAVVDSLLERYPGDAEAYVFRGGLLELKRDFEGSIRSYQDAVEADTSYAPAAMMLGYAYSGNNEQDKALAQMERYIRLVPGAADPRASYADLLLRVGRYDEALDQYRQSLTLKPDYWYAINQIGTIYSLQGRLRDAERQFEEGYRSLPQSPQLEAAHLATRAGLEFSRGQYQHSIDLYVKALRIDSTNLSAAYGLAYTLAKTRTFGEAGALAQRIEIELQRRNLMGTQIMLSFHLMKAYLAMEEGQLDLGRAECEQALEGSSPITRPSVYRQLAEILLRQQAYDDALDACSEALGVNPHSPSALLTLTRIYWAKRDTAMTREIADRLLSLWKNADPDFQDRIELKRILGGGSPAS